MAGEKTKLVRLKPFDPKRGYLLRRYMVNGHRFDEERGWYEVPTALADALAKHRQPSGPGSFVDETPPAFDIKSKVQAQAIDKKEAAQKDRQPADAPVDLTTADLRKDVAPKSTSSRRTGKQRRTG